MDEVKTLASKKIEEGTEYDAVRLMLSNERFMATFSDHLSPAIFRESLKPVVEISLKYWQEHRKLCPMVAMVQELAYKVGHNFTEEKQKSVEALLMGIKQEPKAPEYTQQQIADFVRFQRMENASIRALRICEEADKTKDLSKLDEIPTLIQRASQPLSLERPTLFFRDIEKRTDYRTKLALGEIEMVGFGTGIPELDDTRVPARGLLRKELGVAIAPTGRGKSIFLQHIATVAAFKGFNVIYFSLELPEEMLCNRADSMVTQTNVSEVIEQRNEICSYIKDLKDTYNLGEIVFKDLSLVGPTCNNLRNEIDQIMQVEGIIPDIIVVDYMDLMMPDTKVKEGGWKEQQKVAEELRALGGQLNCAVWTASQGNRGSAKKNEEGEVLEDTDTAESYNKLFATDWVVTLNRTKTFMEMPEPKPLWIKVVKNRTGIPGVRVGVLTNFGKMQFFVGKYDEQQEKDKLEQAALDSGAFVEKKKGKKNG